jgi:CheY-like chemotaxis protein
MGKEAKRSGRPPAGLRPGERVSDYPQLSTRIPEEAFETLQALATMHRVPQWRVIANALDRYIQELKPEEQALLAETMRRAERLLEKPAKPRRGPMIPESVKILNVDDNEPMLFARSLLLRTEGFHVLEAKTGKQALQIVETQRPRLVLLDVHLPDMSGLDVCRLIKSNEELGDIKVVQTSATFRSPHDQLEGLEAGGADLYLTEPVPRGTLLSVVRRLLDTSAAPSTPNA